MECQITEVCQLLSIPYVLAMPKMLPDDIFLFLLQVALPQIREGIAKKAAATKYKIPRSTLQFRLSCKTFKIFYRTSAST